MNAAAARTLPEHAARPAAAAPGLSPARWLAERARGPMPRGSVLVHAHSAAFQAPGGGENQLVQTAMHLERLGVPVRPFVPWTDQLTNARLLHLFGMSREGLELARVARARGVPVVLSPICWVEPRAIAALAPTTPLRALEIARWAAMMAAPRRPGWRRALLNLSSAILPNSAAEAHQLTRLFGADPARIEVVPNGVDPRFAEATPARFRAVLAQWAGASDAIAAAEQGGFILYVGRVEPRKNPLALVRAARRLGRPVVLIGQTVPGHEAYAAACRREGEGLLAWLPRMDHDDPRLASAYAAARVFALASWFETPGLAALEAALAGAAVALTPFGCTREYFGDRVHYARPGRVGHIVQAIDAAWHAGPHPGLAAHVRRHFLWAHVAQRTAEVYDTVAA